MKSVEITGTEENARAMMACDNVDYEKAGTEAARTVLPYVKSGTRAETGLMRSAWIADDGGFVNDVDYAGYQEFGTQSISPANAIGKAVDSHGDQISKAYEKEVDRASSKAGLGGQ